MSSSCPHCHRQLAIADIVVRARHWGTSLQTCGRIIVDRRADVRVTLLKACAGVEVHGTVKGRIVSLGPVTLGDTAQIDGDLEAPAVFVAPGAKILGGKFSISPVAPGGRASG
ncbi:MAG: polymer-forming cytoskeletal protein [Phycisphaerales bacterium]|nr:polymer-forming cytoskeletal protein [Phycisphaerales bacterium]